MTTPRQRQRNSVNLSEEGKSAVQAALNRQDLSQEEWAKKAFVSISTVKRLLSRTKVDKHIFDTMCTSLGLKPDELLYKY